MEFVWTAKPGLLDRFGRLAVIHPLKIRLQAFVLRQSAGVSPSQTREASPVDGSFTLESRHGHYGD